MSYTVSQVADALGVTSSTIRLNWSTEFAEFLSAGANPPKGETRLFTDGDVAILETVAVLRNQQKSYEEIKQALADDVRLEFDQPPDDAPQAADDAPETAVVTQAYQTTLQAYERRIDQYETKVDKLTERLLDAEKRATAAETEARMLREQMEQEQGQSGKEAANEEPPATWWDRLLGRE